MLYEFVLIKIILMGSSISYFLSRENFSTNNFNTFNNSTSGTF